MKAKDMNSVLYIDLKKKDIKIEDRVDLFGKYLGGSGVAIKLLEEECQKGEICLCSMRNVSPF